MSFWPIVKKVIKDADIVLFVLDARMPQLSKNRELPRLTRKYKKQLWLVFNKVDLLTQQELIRVRGLFPDASYVSGKEGIGIQKLQKDIEEIATFHHIENPTIGVVGYPNVGKSSIINQLARRTKAKVSPRAGTTKNIQWINAGPFRILDSPGVIPIEDNSLKLGVLGAKEPEKMKAPERAAAEVVRHLLDNGKKYSLEKTYGLTLESNDDYEIVLAIGKKRAFLMKGGIVDERKAAIQILRDWQRGKIK